MTEVYWPMRAWPLNNIEICDWLEDLTKLDPKAKIFELSKSKDRIFFEREEDALAFKLRFGL